MLLTPRCVRFHHIEFYCGDATNTCRRFQLGLGMDVVAKSDLSTGNDRFASYCVKSNDFMLVFSAPYGNVAEGPDEAHPGFNGIHATEFFRKHGVAARAIGKAPHLCLSPKSIIHEIGPSLGPSLTPWCELHLLGLI